MIDMKYTEIIKKNKELEKTDQKFYNISFLSNIMNHQLKEILEYSLRSNGINANVVLGDYDNIVQDSMKLQEANAVVIFWEIYNLIDGLEYKIETLAEQEYDELIKQIKLEIDIVLNNLQKSPLILFNRFSSVLFNYNALKNNRLEQLSHILNEYVLSKGLTNLNLIDINNCIAKLSIDKVMDLRYYKSSKTLYTINFYKTYSEYILPIFLSVNGKAKKALIFDCDNTLWKGILGEDGFDNIKMYKDIQYLAIELAKNGVIIGLCSKNNQADVDEVLQNHKECVLKDKHLVIKKVNWNDKVSNLKAIAKDLNIGLDSLVFVDDSDFEVNLIKEALPMIEVIQVPQREYEYFLLMNKVKNLFFNNSVTNEDLKKIKMYKDQVKRISLQDEIGDIEEYLKSLKLNITYFEDDLALLTRISQMTQKTNQFNLTTKRYTEQNIKNFIDDNNYSVIAIEVSDRFGDSGVVGLAIVKYQENIAIIDSLLMSCRVLGRNVEFKFFSILVDIFKKRNINCVKAQYIKTLKNSQVSDLYDKIGFEIEQKDDNITSYSVNITKFKENKIDYIGVKNGK